jgi:hypothetical protein
MQMKKWSQFKSTCASLDSWLASHSVVRWLVWDNERGLQVPRQPGLHSETLSEKVT